MRIIIRVEGGMVQAVYSDGEAAVEVMDHDTDDAEELALVSSWEEVVALEIDGGTLKQIY